MKIHSVFVNNGSMIFVMEKQNKNLNAILNSGRMNNNIVYFKENFISMEIQTSDSMEEWEDNYNGEHSPVECSIEDDIDNDVNVQCDDNISMHDVLLI